MIDFKNELKKLALQEDPDFFTCKQEISTAMGSLNDLIKRFSKKQSSLEIQMEEIYSLLEEKSTKAELAALKKDNENLVQALIAAADLTEDYYLYAQEHGDSSTAAQATLMWNALNKAMSAAGLCRIADENTPVNPKLNHIEGITQCEDVPEGWVVHVLRSGYQYKNQIYRKSDVSVRKGEKRANEQDFGD